MRRLPFLILILLFISLARPEMSARAWAAYDSGNPISQLRTGSELAPYQAQGAPMNFAAAAQQATATTAPILPATDTPQADGSIVHVVREGETLITIAQAYNITLRELLALNNLTSTSVIFPGEKLIIRKASTATPTPEITTTHTPRPATPTRRPTRTPTSLPPSATATIILASPTATPAPAKPMDTYGKVMVGAIVAFGVIGVVLMVTGEVIKRKK